MRKIPFVQKQITKNYRRQSLIGELRVKFKLLYIYIYIYLKQFFTVLFYRRNEKLNAVMHANLGQLGRRRSFFGISLYLHFALRAHGGLQELVNNLARPFRRRLPNVLLWIEAEAGMLALFDLADLSRTC